MGCWGCFFVKNIQKLRSAVSKKVFQSKSLFHRFGSEKEDVEKKLNIDSSKILLDNSRNGILKNC